MPDPAPSSKRPPIAPVSPGTARPPYAELHCKTNFSFLEGASHPDELVLQAAQLGYAALAITDRHSLAGVVRAHGAAKQVGLKLLIGAEIHPADAGAVVLWATDRASYGRLSQLITEGCRRAPKGEFQLAFDDLAGRVEGLLAGVVLRDCRPWNGATTPKGTVPFCFEDSTKGDRPTAYFVRGSNTLRGSKLHASRPTLHASDNLHRYRDLFGDRCYALAELHCGPDDERLLDHWLRLTREARVPLVAAGDVHYHARSRLALADMLTATRLRCTVAQAGEALFPNAERYLKSPKEMLARFAAAPGAAERSREIADRCTFSLDQLRYEYPEELAPPGKTPLAYLAKLTWQGAAGRYPEGVPDKVRGLIEHELALIGELRYEAYFLTVYDLIRFARSRDILCQGRGSAANSAVCFCLGVTPVDPSRMSVLFERFISRERDEAPDIDIDFEHERREEVLQYLYEKYGRERAGIVAEVITYRPRSAVRDVGKALGLSLDRIDALSKSMDVHHETSLADRCRGVGLDPDSFIGRRLVGLVGELIGFPRHLGQHVGGMVMTRDPLADLVPIENAAMPDRTVIQWNKDDLDELGILKVDCLSLGMLTAIRKCFELIKLHEGRELSIATVPAEEPAVYDMICRAETMGVFQIESRAQMSMLPRLKPREFYDLVIEVAIVRPGPIQGDMVHPFLRRRNGEEIPAYPNDAIREVLEKTLGVPLFQEQAMRLAVVAAGFTPGEADQLRRAMGAWRKTGVIEQFRQKLLEGMLARGLSAEFAGQVFHQIRGFGEYGFPESHAASFAILVYVSAWLKHNYPAAFTASLINSQPMGFYAPAQLIRDLRDQGGEVRGVDVNSSDWDCTLEPFDALSDGWPGLEALRPSPGCSWKAETTRGAPGLPFGPVSAIHQSSFDGPRKLCGANTLRLGFRMLIGLREVDARRIVEIRQAGKFRSLDDFVARARLSQAVVARLAEADAFGSLQIGRRAALWQSLAVDRQPVDRPLFDDLTYPEQSAELPPLSAREEVLADYQTAGLSLKAHPIQFHREQLAALQVVTAARLATIDDGTFVRVAGLVLVRQRPGTAKGITFVTLEDETGVANLIIRPDIWRKFYRPARSAAALIAHGRLQNQQGVIHVLTTRLIDLSAELKGLASQSRDFH